MELGEKLRQARLETGLSQRQLCGDVITRNMLSQIEHGAARPSMDTLRYLAGRLGKPVSFFLEEDALASPNAAVMERARAAFAGEDWTGLEYVLEEYQSPDPIFQEEWKLLRLHSLLQRVEVALAQGKGPFALELLAQTEEISTESLYAAPELTRRRLLLEARAGREDACSRLPSLDEELLLRAEAALKGDALERCLWLLGAVEDQTGPRWNYLRGRLYLTQEDYPRAAQCLERAEEAYPQTAALLETCYREMEDYRRAYLYAVKQKR